MQVNNIQSNNHKNYNTPNFGLLKFSTTEHMLSQNYHINAEGLQKINTWKNELAETKGFNLALLESGNNLWPVIFSKNAYFPDDCGAPLQVFEKPSGKSLNVYGADPLACGDEDNTIWYPLKFLTEKDAEIAYETLKNYQDAKSDNIIDIIAWSVDSVKILEQGTEYLTKPKAAKVQSTPETNDTELSFRQVLQILGRTLKAWLTDI